MFNEIDEISPVYQNMENVTKKKHNYNFPFFAKNRKIEN